MENCNIFSIVAKKLKCHGCFYADEIAIQEKRPCCTYGFKLDIDGDNCQTRKSVNPALRRAE